MLILSFFWFWFWRPYGFYGGDSEYLDRQINGGLWFRKRELFAVAAMQLSRQFLTLQFGWPVSWSISFVSCAVGSLSVLLAWLMYKGREESLLGFFLVVSSGYLLLYHGSIESYALPTFVLMLWIFSIDRVHRRAWPTYTIAFSMVLMAWCHLMALFLFPSLMISAWIYREQIRRDELVYWIVAAIIGAWLYVFIDVLQYGQGQGFGFWDLFYHTDMPGTEETGTFLTAEHFQIKLYFIWVATHITLPFALFTCLRYRSDPFVLQVGGMLFGSIAMVVFFHPDCGYDDWDLFLLPSLPAAVLGALGVHRLPWRSVVAILWVLAFLSLWVPRIPSWARLSERGLAEVEIINFPSDRTVYWVHGETTHYYKVTSPTFWPQGGAHRIAVEKPAYVTQFEDFEVSPGDQIDILAPIKDIEVPFADRIRRLYDIDDPSDDSQKETE